MNLHSRSLQWNFTGVQPPTLPKETNAYKLAGCRRHEIVMYYNFIRHLLGVCFEKGIGDAVVLAAVARDWLNNPQAEFSGRTPAGIIEIERERINLTASTHECLIEEDCEACRMTTVDFTDTPTFCHYDSSHFEFDRFEFSFHENRADWEAEQREYEEISRRFDGKRRAGTTDDVFDDGILF